MLILVLGVALWTVVHLLPAAAPARRAALIAQHGEGRYKGAYTVALVVALVLIWLGWTSASRVDLWFPPAFLTHLNNLLMLVAFVVFGAGAAQSNIARVIRHPQLTAVKTWAVAHLLVNGDLASMILFGGMLAWGVMGVIFANKRDGKPPLPGAQPLVNDAKAVGAGLAGFVLLAAVHQWLFGVYPFG